MLKKLIKYEILADWKKYGIISAALLLISIMLLITSNASQRIDNISFITLVNDALGATFGIVAVGAIAMLFVFSTTRFYKSFIRDEGYLTHTLPVPTWQLIASRIIAVYIWFIALAAVLAICFGISEGEPLWLIHVIQNRAELFSIVTDRFGKEAMNSLIKTTISGMLIMLFTPAIYMARICLCFALGNLFSRNKLAMSVLMFFVISFVERIIYSVISISIFADLIAIAETASDEHILSASLNAVNITLVLSLIIMAASFIASERIFAKKLNLE